MAPNGVQADETGAGAGIPVPSRDDSTDWPGLLLALLVPGLLVAGLLSLLIEPQWEDPDSVEWLDGLFVLIPFEFARLLVLRILRDTYREYESPRHAVRFFLISIAALIGICLAMAFAALGMRLFGLLAQAQTWRYILPPLLIIVFDALVNLVFFRGDRGRVAAQLDAAADDAESWFGLACYPTPIVVVFTCFGLFYLHTLGIALFAHVPPPGIEPLRAVVLGYAAAYFSGKAIVVAHVYSAHFLRTGRRLLGAPWVDFLSGKNAQQRAANAAAEVRAAERRLGEMRGERVEASPSARQRRRRGTSG